MEKLVDLFSLPIVLFSGEEGGAQLRIFIVHRIA
jgi:hypothetical protein